MTGHDAEARLSIPDLLSTSTSLFERAQDPLLPDSQGRRALSVRYVRRKPGRGLAVTYAVYAWPAGGRPRASVRVHSGPTTQRVHSGPTTQLVSLTLDEQALDGTCIRFSARQVHQAPLEVQPAGVVRARDLGLTVQAFPADGGLPALAASCTTTPQGPLWQALQSAACVQLCDDAWRLVAAHAEPVRYKPATRCVIRYHLTLEHPHPRGAEPAAHRNLRDLTLFGKVYADRQQARFVEAMMQRLYKEASTSAFGGEQVGLQAGKQSGQPASAPFLPRPLGLSEDFGLRFDEAMQPAGRQEEASTSAFGGEQVRSGVQALQPQVLRARAGGITMVNLPCEELRSTALALARLHTSAVRPAETPPRTAAHEANRACERAMLIAARNPAQAGTVLQLAQQLATHLESMHPDVCRPAHGGFKPSQLLFQGRHVVVVDFDGFCLADAALDVGYFLAYLRPSGLWYHRPGMRHWFEAAAAVFVGAYRTAMLERGIAHAEIDGILERARLYEAALLFKIVTRRIHRLNSTRPQELSAMLGEIATCLAGEARRQ